MEWLVSRAHYRQANFDEPASFDALAASVSELEQEEKTGGNRLFYLAVAPTFIAGIAAQLARVKLVDERGERWGRLVIEKPFGHDLAAELTARRPDLPHRSLRGKRNRAGPGCLPLLKCHRRTVVAPFVD
jgi:glucose-6-phosphate 1-dehydrogenase